MSRPINGSPKIAINHALSLICDGIKQNGAPFHPRVPGSACVSRRPDHRISLVLAIQQRQFSSGVVYINATWGDSSADVLHSRVQHAAVNLRMHDTPSQQTTHTCLVDASHDLKMQEKKTAAEQHTGRTDLSNQVDALRCLMSQVNWDNRSFYKQDPLRSLDSGNKRENGESGGLSIRCPGLFLPIYITGA